MSKVKITDTTLRDAHQSLIATRLETEDMLEIVEEMDRVDTIHLRCGAGPLLILL
jgi:Pyruvate/oxaloacetate carboxyltransferase